MFIVIMKLSPLILMFIASTVTALRIITSPMPIGLKIGDYKKEGKQKYSLQLTGGEHNYFSAVKSSSIYATSLIFLFLASITNIFNQFIETTTLEVSILNIYILFVLILLYVGLYSLIYTILKTFVGPRIVTSKTEETKIDELTPLLPSHPGIIGQNVPPNNARHSVPFK